MSVRNQAQIESGHDPNITLDATILAQSDTLQSKKTVDTIMAENIDLSSNFFLQLSANLKVHREDLCIHVSWQDVIFFHLVTPTAIDWR